MRPDVSKGVQLDLLGVDFDAVSMESPAKRHNDGFIIWTGGLFLWDLFILPKYTCSMECCLH